MHCPCMRQLRVPGSERVIVHRFEYSHSLRDGANPVDTYRSAPADIEKLGIRNARTSNFSYRRMPVGRFHLTLAMA